MWWVERAVRRVVRVDVRVWGRVECWSWVVWVVRFVRWVARFDWVVGLVRRNGFVGVCVIVVGLEVEVSDDGRFVDVRRLDSVRSVLIKWVERTGPMVGREDWNVFSSSVRRSSMSVERGRVDSGCSEVERYEVMLKTRSWRSGGRLTFALLRVFGGC